MSRQTRYSPEVRERAVRLVREHAAEYPSQWAAIRSIAEKIGCTHETLWSLVRTMSAMRACGCCPLRWSRAARYRHSRCARDERRSGSNAASRTGMSSSPVAIESSVAETASRVTRTDREGSWITGDLRADPGCAHIQRSALCPRAAAAPSPALADAARAGAAHPRSPSTSGCAVRRATRR